MTQNPFKSAQSAVKLDLSRRSLLAKADPYSNKTHKRIDILLVVITLVLMIFAFRASAQHWATSSEQTRAAHSQSNH